MRKATILLVLAILFSVMMVGAPSSAADRVVRGVGFSFVPAIMSAAPGDTIRLNNEFAANLPHTWTTDDPICRGKLLVFPFTDNLPVTCDVQNFGSGVSTTSCVQIPNTNMCRYPQLLSNLGSHNATSSPYNFYCSIHEGLGMRGRLYINFPTSPPPALP